eukprot:TRINITY_DN5755_c0_g1_i1.p1 TRINITY_DN5755_c0_g1~~TRINITY_DN5755_c0_g1_i1.p1  ORF type:complete len:250 (-),score=44.40 TRINITY_DN5755_c0_g1_i1:86-835(-)
MFLKSLLTQTTLSTTRTRINTNKHKSTKRFYPQVRSLPITQGIYTGQVNEDKIPHGKGRLTMRNGNIFEGEFKNGFKSKGKMSNPETGEYYNGEFLNDVFHGRGTFRMDIMFYEGEFFNGEMAGTGVGKLRHNNGVYSGIWRRNRFKEGVCKLPSGEIFEGEFNEEFLPHGKIKYQNADNETFEGNFENGLPVKGKKVHKDKSVTVCYYKDGLPHGIGYLSLPGYPDELGCFNKGEFTPGIREQDWKLD